MFATHTTTTGDSQDLASLECLLYPKSQFFIYEYNAYTSQHMSCRNIANTSTKNSLILGNDCPKIRTCKISQTSVRYTSTNRLLLFHHVVVVVVVVVVDECLWRGKNFS